MKNFIEYFYNIKIDRIFYEKNYYFFTYNGYTYKLYTLTSEYDVNFLLYINQKMLNNTLVSEIIFNKNMEIISVYNENRFMLIKIFVNMNKNISLSEILFLNNYLNSKKLSVNWGQLWEKKIDYLEELINENGKKYPLIVNSFNYFVGMTENAINYYNSINIGNDINYVISHRSIKVGDTIESLYNPLNIILDYRVRDIAEYIKISFFKNNKLIFKEMQEYLINSNLSLTEVQLLVARLLYPSFYFDMYDDIMIDNQEEKILTFILANLDNYEIYLSNVIELIRQRYNVDEIAWLKKNHS